MLMFISYVNVHKAGSFTKFDERDPDNNFFDNITKSSFQTSYFTVFGKARDLKVNACQLNSYVMLN